MFFALVIAEKKSTFAHFAALIRWSCWHYPNFVSPKLIEQSIFHNFFCFIASFVLVEKKIPIFVRCLKYINRKKCEFVCIKQQNVFIRANRLYAKWLHELVGFVYSVHNDTSQRKDDAVWVYACVRQHLFSSLRCAVNQYTRLVKESAKHAINKNTVSICQNSNQNV